MVSTQRSIGIDNAKLLYNFIRGDQSNWLFFLGGETGVENPINTIQDDNDVWDSVNFLQKVRDTDVSIVGRRVNWKSGGVYYPYQSTGIPAGETGEARNYYAITDKDEVFVCLGSDEKNRYDLRGLNSSTVKPTRDRDDETLEDGYRWKFLYKVDLDQLKFKTTNYIPVPDINEYDVVPTGVSLREEAFRRGCGLNIGETGACCLYHKNDALEPVTDNIYRAGQLDFCIDNVLCSKCFEVARGLNREFIFRPNEFCGRTGATGSTGCAPKISIKSGYELAIDGSKFLSSNSNTKLQSEVYKNAKENEGKIHNVFIDLSGLTEEDLTITTENPVLTLSSQTGEGAEVRLTTYKKGQNYVVDGIQLRSAGRDYRDISIVGAPIENLGNRITFALDYQGGLFADPRRLIGATKVMIKVVVRADQISDTADTSQSTFTRYGLFRDVKTNRGGAEIIAGSGTNRNESEVFTNKFKITLKQLPTLGSDLFVFGDNPTIAKSTSISNVTKSTKAQSNLTQTGAKTKESSKVTFFGPVTGESSKAALETISNAKVKGSLKRETPYRVGDVISDNVTGQQFRFEVESIDAEPTITPFTGELVSSNVTNVTTSTAPKEVSFQFIYTLGSY